MNKARNFEITGICRTAGVFLLMMALFSASVSAVDEGYTMSLRASSEVVNPGDTIQLAVQVHNDGWPDAGEAEVAAFQAALDYDHESLQYLSVDIAEGTMGDFDLDSGLVLGYGQGHVFEEFLDCAVLTMKVSGSASGEIPVTLDNAILAKQDASELKVSTSDPLVLKVGGEATEESRLTEVTDSGLPGNSVSAGTDRNTGSVISGQDSSAGNRQNTPSDQAAAVPENDPAGRSGTISGQTDNQTTQKSTSGKSGKDSISSQTTKDENTSGKNKSAERVEQADPENSETAVAADAGSSSDSGAGLRTNSEKNSESGSWKKIVGLLAVAAMSVAAASGFVIYRKRR